MKKAVCIIIKNEEGKILGVSRKKLPNIEYTSDPHVDFGLPGGKMDLEDATTDDAIKRELKEETGLHILNLLKIDCFEWGGYEQNCYIGEVAGEINYDEPHVVEWVDKEKLFEGSFGEYNKMQFEKFKTLIENYTYSTCSN